MEEAYTYEYVLAMANRAADLVSDGLQLPDCGRRDVVNLVVNALGSLLKDPEMASLDDVIRDNYDPPDPAQVRAWCAGVHGW